MIERVGNRGEIRSPDFPVPRGLRVYLKCIFENVEIRVIPLTALVINRNCYIQVQVSEMHNTWELEEDDDSDVSGEAAPINRQKVAVTTTSGGKPHEFLNSRVTKVSQADNSVNRNNTNQHFATSSNGFYSDDDIDDLDVEELPESFPSSKNIMEVPTKNDLTTNHLVTRVANGSNQYGSSSTGIASDRDLLDREEISVEKLKRAYDEAAKASQGGGYSSELSVDKM